MAQLTIDEKIVEFEEEVTMYTKMLQNQGGYKSIAGAGTEGAKTEFVDPLKIKNLRQEARDRLAHARLRKTQGYTV